jgi:hypothetical protein
MAPAYQPLTVYGYTAILRSIKKGLSVPSQESTAPSSAPKPAASPHKTPSHPAHIADYESNPIALLRPSWEGFKLNAAPIIGAILAVIALILGLVVIAAVIGAVSHNIAVMVCAVIAAFLVGALVIALLLAPALTRLQLASARRHKMTWSEARADSVRVGWRLFLVGLLVGLTVLGGLILLIVPGLIFGVWFSQAAYAVVDEDLGPVDAMKRSRNLVRNRFWDVAGVLAFFQATSILQFVPFLGSIAALVLNIIFSPLQTIRYYQLVNLKKTSDGKGIATHPANFGLILLAVVAGGVDSSHRASMMAPPHTTLENNAGPY